MTVARIAAVCALLPLLALACGEAESEPSPAVCTASVAPPSSGFGARGPHGSAVVTLSNPLVNELNVSVHLPVGAAEPVPVVLFAHANEQGDPAIYAALIDHITSRGYAVVFSPYTIGSVIHRDRYSTLWAGFEAAIEALPRRLDRARMAFVGHSYGAGALPFVAWRALREKGWGKKGALLYSMAPWYALDVDSERLHALPDHLRVLIQVFEEDTATDHRIAIEQFHAIGVPDDFKEFVRLRSDVHGACRQAAVHTVPQSTGLRARDDGIDVYGVYRLFDALAAFAFSKDEAGRRIAFGHGSTEQVDMGYWSDGTPVTPLEVSRDPQPLYAEERYIFRHSDREGWRRYGETVDGAASGSVPTPGGEAPGP